MEDTNVISGNKFSELSKKFEIGAVNKIISTFVGYEKEYKDLLSNTESSKTSFFRDDSVVIVSPEPEIAEVITHSIKLSDIMKKVKKELDIISDNLKDYGADKIREWNKNNDETVASVRLQSEDGDRTVMITVKNTYSIDANKLSSIKKEIGPNFDKVFKTSSVWTIKNDSVKNVISIIKNALGKAGNAFIKDSFIETVTYSVNSRKDFESLLNDQTISDDIKAILKDCVKPQAPAITYPK